MDKKPFYTPPVVFETALEPKLVLCLSSYTPEIESENLENLGDFDALW